MLDHVPRISADRQKCVREDRVENLETDEVEPGLGVHYPALMDDVSSVVEHG